MESYKLELHPVRGQAHVCLFRNVTNAPELRQRLINQDATMACALVNAELVINPFHVMLAANRAAHDEKHNQLKTHNINSEIVFDFSSTIHISQSLKRFGIEDTTTDIIAVKLGGTSEEAIAFMKDNIKGDVVALDQLDQIRDLKRIQKYYQTGDVKEDPVKLMQLVAGAMALKGL
ncbi:kinase binding protein CGI-121-domain-containing protein [Phycomyces blakesleeanus]|uniref:EKC/KEOPS complex subunit CGI121 n=2 Tax=Phycomyces blakesleeanus TaxID=4837 RepID=A0A162UH98_PHYB8|nr:hypothetical protein PHYBLDRAFT_180585 [Phycomyces blakesleeanus NRRL 1555(-)]OAD76232.1 hypothetical protein PHYBLDRAFT_180585 [Phycomyces blakesleeanus NRRL 1555(-)]|eukprot:XP_018294272.1 hypothetical protein PHYBLDRAFT_180585 [Phycomyces blakesleeanus NRRL 1555(-)]